MMLLEVYYTIRFLKLQIYLFYLKKARRSQKDFLTLTYLAVDNTKKEFWKKRTL